MTIYECPRCGHMLDMDYEKKGKVDESEINPTAASKAGGYCMKCVCTWKIQTIYVEKKV